MTKVNAAKNAQVKGGNGKGNCHYGSCRIANVKLFKSVSVQSLNEKEQSLKKYNINKIYINRKHKLTACEETARMVLDIVTTKEAKGRLWLLKFISIEKMDIHMSVETH